MNVVCVSTSSCTFVCMHVGDMRCLQEGVGCTCSKSVSMQVRGWDSKSSLGLDTWDSPDQSTQVGDPVCVVAACGRTYRRACIIPVPTCEPVLLVQNVLHSRGCVALCLENFRAWQISMTQQRTIEITVGNMAVCRGDVYVHEHTCQCLLRLAKIARKEAYQHLHAASLPQFMSWVATTPMQNVRRKCT